VFDFALSFPAEAMDIPPMGPDEIKTLVEDATLDFALGENDAALEKLQQATQAQPTSFEAWHALTEIYFSMRELDAALHAGERALALNPDDIHIHTSLSRIHMERGDKATAEKHGAQARMLGWKQELQGQPEEE
jgi:cytochrome c-type biogenesis protein CcmH/NrfG